MASNVPTSPYNHISIQLHHHTIRNYHLHDVPARACVSMQAVAPGENKDSTSASPVAGKPTGRSSSLRAYHLLHTGKSHMGVTEQSSSAHTYLMSMAGTHIYHVMFDLLEADLGHCIISGGPFSARKQSVFATSHHCHSADNGGVDPGSWIPDPGFWHL